MKLAGENLRRAKNSAITLNILILFASIISILIWSFLDRNLVTTWNYKLSLVVSIVALLLLWRVQRHLLAWSFALVVVPMVVILRADMLLNIELSHYIWRFEPFIGNKLLAFSVAMIGIFPEILGYLLIGLSAGVPVFSYYFLIPPEFRQNIMPPEPWASVVFSVMAAVIFAHRNREAAFEREVMRAEEELRAAQERAANYLALLDLANTPLQTIELATVLLNLEHPESAQLIEPIKASLVRLRTLSDVLANNIPEIEWKKADLRFDALKVLRNEDGEFI